MQVRSQEEIVAAIRRLFELAKALRTADHDLAPHALLMVRSLLWVLGAKDETPLEIMKDSILLLEQYQTKAKN